MVPPTSPCTSVHFSSSSVRASAAPLVTFQVYIPSLLTLKVWGSYNQISRRQVMQMTRLEDLTPAPSMTLPIEHSSRPTLGFPLGTALLLLVIFALSGMFSCCYHWDKLRSLWSRHPALFEESEHTAISIASSPSKTTSDHKVNFRPMHTPHPNMFLNTRKIITVANLS